MGKADKGEDAEREIVQGEAEEEEDSAGMRETEEGKKAGQRDEICDDGEWIETLEMRTRDICQ